MASNISDTRPLSSSNLKGNLPTASSSLGIPSSTTTSTTPATTTTSMVPPLSTSSISSTGMPQVSPALPAGVIWRWVDHVMRRERGQSAVSWTSLKGIEDPSADFADGIRLIRLIETLSGHRATGPFHLSTTSGGLDEFDSVDNIRMAFRMLRSEGLEPGFKPAYLYRPGPQRQHLLTDLLWRIMLHFRFYQHAIGTRGAAGYSPEERMDLIRQYLLDWVRDKTSRHVDNLRLKRIENLSSGWDDGLIYLILLHEYDPSIVTHDDLRNYSLPGQRARSLATALSLAKRHLGIPKLISSPEGILDEFSNIAFLCEFWYKFYQHEGYGEEHPGIRGVEQREIPRQEPRQYREGGLASSTGGIQQYPRQDRLYREGLASSERGLPYHEEERLRADQMRLEAETERKRAEEERYKAMEAKRKAEADRIAAEQEAKRALDRREMALREKERLEAERRIADDERRQAMEAVRRAEVERLRVEQERKRLEDEVRRAEERARAEDIRRYAQVKMEEAERERFRAQEERRLAREEMILADHELKLAEEERRRADMEMRLAENERLRASREGLYTPEARALPPSPAVVPTQTTVRVVPTHPVATTPIATPAVTTQTLPVHQGPISSVTTHPISLEEKKRRKAEKKARRAQEELSQAEKMRRKEEKRRLRAEADRKRLEDYVVMTQNVLIGVLQLSVVEARGMGRGVHKPYAKVKLEKQKMKTKTIKKTLIPQWRSDFKLYHSDPDAILKVRVYDKGGRFGGKRFIGRVDIPARDLEDGVEQDLWFPLHYKTAYEKKLRAKEKRKREKERYKGWVPEEVRAWRGDEPLGEIHLRLLYRKDPLYTKPGIYDK